MANDKRPIWKKSIEELRQGHLPKGHSLPDRPTDPETGPQPPVDPEMYEGPEDGDDLESDEDLLNPDGTEKYSWPFNIPGWRKATGIDDRPLLLTEEQKRRLEEKEWNKTEFEDPL